MFSQLSQNLSRTFDRLRRKGALTEQDISDAMREIRIALLEADVALPVAKEFIESVKEKAIGQEIIRSVSPVQMVVKLVHDHLVKVLGDPSAAELNLAVAPPAVILMVGLQGSGKTTTSAKLAYHLTHKKHKKVLLASLDIYRPAAQEQLRIIGEGHGLSVLPVVAGQEPLAIADRALQEAKLQSADVVILDTAGRLHIDDTLMGELEKVKARVNPAETLLVADSLTGQDAVKVAKTFHERIGVTGIILTRIDGDGRGGAALSMRHVTQCPILYLGSGEKIEALEPFQAERIASRILDMGDVVALVEKAVANIDQEESKKLERRLKSGLFDFDDLLGQLRQMRKMGGMSGILGMLPGIGKIRDQLEGANIDKTVVGRQEAIIFSMTKKERKNPKLLNASRKLRIAAGSGTTVQEVNRLVKMHLQMGNMMKKMATMDKKTLFRSGMQNLLGNKMPKV